MPHASRALRTAPRRPGARPAFSAPSVRRLALAAAALLLALFAATPAWAHTKLRSSAPASGATVKGDSVREVRLVFTTRVSPDVTSLALLLGTDTIASGGLVPVEGTEGRELALALSAPLAPGAYVVRWRTAGADGHVIRGDFAFIVEGDSADAAAGAAAPVDSASSAAAPLRGVPEAVEAGGSETRSRSASILPVVVRWGGFLAILGMIGAAAFTLLVLRRLGDQADPAVVDRAGYGAWYLAAAAAALSVLTLGLRLWMQAAELYGSASAFDGERLNSLLTGTAWGLGWTLQALATVAFFIGLMVARAPHGRSVGWMGAGVAAVLVAAVPAFSGHAAAVERLTALAITADTLHVLGAGVWLGTLATVLAAGLPASASAPEGEGFASFAAMVRVFSPVALAGGATAAVTGIVSSLFHIGSPGDLFGTTYGRMLLVKLAVLAVVGALGFYNWRRVLPALGDAEGTARLRRTAGFEIALGATVVLVTAILVALPTP
jgi:putative copper export protein/methionine-rich copper-binding protein CopC